MSDTLSRIKLQLRPVNGSVLNGSGSANGDDKRPTSPATKLLINHGKPNYTIQRTPKAQQNGAANPLNNDLQNNNNNRNNYYPYKSAGHVKGSTGIVNTTNGYNSNSSNKATYNKNNHSNNKVTYNSNNNNNSIGIGSKLSRNNSSSSSSSQNGDDFIITSAKLNGVYKPPNSKQFESKDELVDNHHVVLRRTLKPTAAAPADAATNNTQNGNGGGSDENVPEFILRQRRIQERLAKENILDFEARRSGYFTQMVISPTSPNRTSMVETMSSPPVVPSLEMPPPTPASPQQQQQQQQSAAKEASIAEEESALEEVRSGAVANGVVVENANDEESQQAAATKAANGRVVEEEEEVANAIEEMNKAVAGEVDNEKFAAVEAEETVESEKSAHEVKAEEVTEEAANVFVEDKVEEHKDTAKQQAAEDVIVEAEKTKAVEVEAPKSIEVEAPKTIEVETPKTIVQQPQTPIVTVVVTSASEVEDETEVEDNQHESDAAKETAAVAPETANEPVHREHVNEVIVIPTAVAHNEVTVESIKLVQTSSSNTSSNASCNESKPKENGHAVVAGLEEEAVTNQSNGHYAAAQVTISHTNGIANGVSSELITPSLPKPDPSGILGVNYEPKMVVSFSQDLGEPNKYPDTVVKVVNVNGKEEEDGIGEESKHATEIDELKELAKLKFDIKADNAQDVQVTPVLRTD